MLEFCLGLLKAGVMSLGTEEQASRAGATCRRFQAPLLPCGLAAAFVDTHGIAHFAVCAQDWSWAEPALDYLDSYYSALKP